MPKMDNSRHLDSSCTAGETRAAASPGGRVNASRCAEAQFQAMLHSCWLLGSNRRGPI